MTLEGDDDSGRISRVFSVGVSIIAGEFRGYLAVELIDNHL